MIPTEESDSDYNGPFSYTGEWHMLLFGFVYGLLIGWNKSLREEFRKDSHYLISFSILGFVIGMIIQKYKND